MPTYAFKVHRTGNLDVACSVPWRLEGTGANPIPASAFPGGVLPSGTASFAAGAVLDEPSFELLEGDRPTIEQSGRLILRTPVDCKIDPNADRHAITLKGGSTQPPPPGLYEPIKLADLPPSRRTNVTTLGTRTGTAGLNYVLTSDVSNATLTLGGPGSLKQEIVFRGDTDSSAATGLRTLTNCTINIVGDFCGLARLVLRNCRVFINNRSCFVCRCEFTDCSSSRRSEPILDIDTLAKSARFSCHKNDFTDRLGANKSQIFHNTEALEMVYAYNLIEKFAKPTLWTGSNFIFYYGSSANTDYIKSLLDIHHNLIVDCDVHDVIEIKSSDMDFHDNTIERMNRAGVRLRHGARHKVRRNLFIDPAGTGLITCRGGPHEVTENRSRTASGGDGKGNILLYCGNLPWPYDEWIKLYKPGAEINWMCCGEVLCVGNDMGVKVGDDGGGGNRYKAEDCSVGPTSGASRNRSVQLVSGGETGTKRTAVAGYDIDRVLTRMTRSNTGLRAP